MPQYRSHTSTAGRNMAGARALWRATGMKNEDFGKPIIAVANSFTQFVPGHVHLKDLGQLVAREIEAAGGVAKEFNTIAVDDGIAMGHDGMLYSLPSRDIISDSVEYMVNAHCADAMVCISNCDKITPGMLNAAMRLNIPVVFVSGGPMEAGKTKLSEHKLDLVDAMVPPTKGAPGSSLEICSPAVRRRMGLRRQHFRQSNTRAGDHQDALSPCSVDGVRSVLRRHLRGVHEHADVRAPSVCSATARDAWRARHR